MDVKYERIVKLFLWITLNIAISADYLQNIFLLKVFFYCAFDLTQHLKPTTAL